ncbi:major facilitator superfamily domain-containing protein [Lentinula aff. detonsa]|uniref:Major facilitator superfamily domain-containing protein n=1 Tax=Lentinula aff. detonsa TaxID=2804958 RepID=A0AA38KEH5_9AGAR|nr:major facilitator superfamily domain-containing protein [Lentinula aff. detonsa]
MRRSLTFHFPLFIAHLFSSSTWVSTACYSPLHSGIMMDSRHHENNNELSPALLRTQSLDVLELKHDDSGSESEKALPHQLQPIPPSARLGNPTTWKNNTHPQWWRDPGLRRNVFWIAVLYFGFFTWGYSTALLNCLQPLPQFNEYFHNPSGGRLGLIYASQSLPTVILAPAIPWSNDFLGRKRTISIGSLIVISGTIVGTLSRTTGMLIASRVIVGLALPFMSVACVCLVNELAHPRLRGICATVNSSMYFGGVVVVSWLTFGTLHWHQSTSTGTSQNQLVDHISGYSGDQWAWRLPILFQALGPTILLCFTFASLLPGKVVFFWDTTGTRSARSISAFSVPESPRWLVAHGHLAEAHSVLAQVHANGDMEDELVLGELGEIVDCLVKEREEAVGKGMWEGWKDLWRTEGLRRRMIVVTIIGAGSQLKGTSAIASYITPILNLVGFVNPDKIAVINGCLTTCDFISAIAGALCVNSVGRRPLWIISTAGLLVCFAVMTALAAVFAQGSSMPAAYAFIVVLFILRVFNGMGWSPLTHNYPAEILPYSIRARALSFFTFLETSVLAFNLWLHPVAFQHLGWRYFIVFVAVLSALMIAIWFLFIETRGRTIEQVSLLFDFSSSERRNRMGATLKDLEHVNGKSLDEKRRSESSS